MAIQAHWCQLKKSAFHSRSLQRWCLFPFTRMAILGFIAWRSRGFFVREDPHVSCFGMSYCRIDPFLRYMCPQSSVSLYVDCGQTCQTSNVKLCFAFSRAKDVRVIIDYCSTVLSQTMADFLPLNHAQFHCGVIADFMHLIISPWSPWSDFLHHIVSRS